MCETEPKKMGSYIDDARDDKKLNNRDTNPAILLEYAVINTLGNKVWGELQQVVVHTPAKDEEHDGPIEAYIFIRSEMKAAGLLCVSHFNDVFPKISEFDEITYDKNWNAECQEALLRKGVKERCRYCADGAFYPLEEPYLNLGELSAELYGTYRAPRNRAGSYSVSTRTQKGTDSHIVYYYRNELDHLFSYLLLQCYKKQPWNGNKMELGLQAMKEAVCGDRIVSSDWEQGITDETLTNMKRLKDVYRAFE